MTEDDEQDVQTALHCAETGSATHWPTAAGVLAAEVTRLRGLPDDPATIERVARALWLDEARIHFNEDPKNWDAVPEWEKNDFRRAARAAVRALRGDAS